MSWSHDLDAAREVQQRLFPQPHPIAGLDYAGASRPALGVGGDYYDFIRLSNAETGIAIGDVSGKGVSAGLLMASLRAFVHGQTRGRVADLTDLAVNLNRLVYESSAPNRYATFFYAQYDAPSRRLEYVNAGHLPPMIFGVRDGREVVQRLEPSGPVIGLMEGCAYESHTVTLEEGDVLVLFTDGITEAMDGAGDEWGEARLEDRVRANRALPARDLLDEILRGAEAFADGTPQYDDMTLIAARVTPAGSRMAS